MTEVPARRPLRDRALEDVYDLIRENPGITRGDLTRMTGISRSAMTNTVARLVAHSRISEKDAPPPGIGTGSGRPGNLLFATVSQEIVGGIDFGHRHIMVAIGDSLGNEIDSEITDLNVDMDARGAMDRAAAMLLALCARHDVPRLARVAAGIPGPIDEETGLVQSHTILSGWVGLRPAAELSALLGTQVHVENDAVLGATGEVLIGAARNHRNVIYLKVSDGIGAALVIGGRSYRGTSGLAGEIGHTRLEGSSDLCRCGNRGCLEAVISTDAIIFQLTHAHQGDERANLDSLSYDDPVTARIFNEAGRTIGRVVADHCNLVNPSMVVVGGKLGTAHPAMIEGIRSAIDRYAQPATAAAVTIVAAGLNSKSEIHGALQLAALAKSTAANY